MNVNRPDMLDQVIDDVARSLVSAPQDREMATRIAAALPPRPAPWFVMTPRWAVHAIGVASLVVVASLLWMNRGPVADPVPAVAGRQPIPAAPMIALAQWSAATANASRRTSSPRAASPEIVVADHERALPPVGAPAQIMLAALVEDTLAIAPATLEPLSIDALVDGGAPPVEPKEQ